MFYDTKSDAEHIEKKCWEIFEYKGLNSESKQQEIQENTLGFHLVLV